MLKHEFKYENDAIYVIQKIDKPSSVMYFNGSIYHSASASSEDIISSLSSMIYDKDVLKTQAALMSLIHMKISAIKEKHCS